MGGSQENGKGFVRWNKRSLSKWLRKATKYIRGGRIGNRTGRD